MTEPRCQWLLEDDTECGAPAVWTTDDLAEFRHLCGECNRDAFTRNDFRAERIAA